MPRILVVHPASDDRAMYAEYLKAHGYGVVSASTTHAAVPLIASADLLITELKVSGSMNAVTLIAGAKRGEWGRRIPVIVVTASILGELHDAARAAGADRVLLKPYFPRDLLNEVEAVLIRRR